MLNTILKTVSLEDMPILAQRISAVLRSGDVIAFYGDLGAGKSTLSRHILQDLNPEILDVPSPTFTLVQTYDIKKGEQCFDVWHMDWYRLKGQSEIQELGVEEAFANSVCLIEWAEKAEDILPENTLYIALQSDDTNNRTIQITGYNWQNRLEKILQDYKNVY